MISLKNAAFETPKPTMGFAVKCRKSHSCKVSTRVRFSANLGSFWGGWEALKANVFLRGMSELVGWAKKKPKPSYISGFGVFTRSFCTEFLHSKSCPQMMKCMHFSGAL